MPLKPSPEYCKDFIESQIASCEQEHVCCVPLGESPLPKRVLDVQDVSGLIKLIETAGGDKTAYTALSHCWGASPRVLKTTHYNIQSHLSGIPWTDLPRTFQDVIALTRCLGIRCIWIDSLCIMQGDTLDWEIQSSKMGQIYSSSFLCIAATGSEDSDGGLFFNRWAIWPTFKDYSSPSPSAIPISMKPIELPVLGAPSHSKIYARPVPRTSHSLGSIL